MSFGVCCSSSKINAPVGFGLVCRGSGHDQAEHANQLAILQAYRSCRLLHHHTEPQLLLTCSDVLVSVANVRGANVGL